MERIDQTLSDQGFALLREHLGSLKWSESEIGCMVIGLGGLERRDYLALKHEGLDVLWHGFDGPWFLWPIYLVSASEHGAVRARHSGELLKIFDSLSQQTACEVLFLDASFLTTIIDRLNSDGLSGFEPFKSDFMRSHGIVSLWAYTDMPADTNVVWCETYTRAELAESILQSVKSLGQSVPSAPAN